MTAESAFVWSCDECLYQKRSGKALNALQRAWKATGAQEQQAATPGKEKGKRR